MKNDLGWFIADQLIFDLTGSYSSQKMFINYSFSCLRIINLTLAGVWVNIGLSLFILLLFYLNNLVRSPP